MCSVLVDLFACSPASGGVYCSVIKVGSDDPDITRGCEIGARVAFKDAQGIEVRGGEGVGIVTKPGLQVPPGRHAINPIPLSIIIDNIEDALSEGREDSLRGRGLVVEVIIPEGRRLAAKTFNPRLGIEGGLSVLGTTGFVTPRSEEALEAAYCLGLKVAEALGYEDIAVVPGNIGRRAVLKSYSFAPDQVVEAGNFLGSMLSQAKRFQSLLVAGHPGKLAKIIAGEYDTHSGRSQSALSIVIPVAADLGIPLDGFDSGTVEGLLRFLQPEERERLAVCLCVLIRERIVRDFGRRVEVALCDMEARIIAATEGCARWR
jgi:cobalt-precorrin-5B (C1)-methyltransferase